MRVFLETERLILRRFTTADTHSLTDLDADPNVMHFVKGEYPHLALRSRTSSCPTTSATRCTGSAPRSRRPPGTSSAGSTSGRGRAPPRARSSSVTDHRRPADRSRRVRPGQGRAGNSKTRADKPRHGNHAGLRRASAARTSPRLRSVGDKSTCPRATRPPAGPQSRCGNPRLHRCPGR